MKKSKFSEEQIATPLRQIDAGAPVREGTRKLRIREATYYLWQKRYGQMAIAEIWRLRQLEEENRKLKQLVADLTLDTGSRGVENGRAICGSCPPPRPSQVNERWSMDFVVDECVHLIARCPTED